MTRRIPAAASIVLPDTRLLTPTKTVFAGSSTNTGHWFDMASVHNLNLAMVHAQPVHQQNWDGGFVFNVGGFTSRYQVIVPKLTNQHTSITCRVYGHSPSGAGGGAVRFTATTPATTATVTLPAAAAWTAAAPTLDVAGSFGVLESEIVLVETEDDVNIQAIELEYAQINPGGLYPGADDELASGIGPDSTIPLDTSELAADSPLSSEFAQTLDAGIAAVSTRLRTYSAVGSIQAGGFNERPFRVVIPVYDLGASVHTLKYRVLANRSGLGAVNHIIQHSNASSDSGQENWINDRAPRGFTRETVPAGAGVYDSGEISISLDAGNIVQAPPGYFGFAHLTVYPGPDLLAFSAWGI